MPKLYLAQTDTTAGLLSQDLARLNLAKRRPSTQKSLIAVPSLRSLSAIARVSSAYKMVVRRSAYSKKRITFLYPNSLAARVISSSAHTAFLKDLGWAFSSSANLHGEKFDENWARNVADEVVDDELFEGVSSAMWRLGRARKRRMR